MIKQISGTGSGTVLIEDFSKGINLTNIRKDSTIKVDLVSGNGADRNVYPLMTIQEYADMFTSLLPREQVLISDNVAYENIYIPFSVSGVLPFTEDEHYVVTLGNLNNRTVTVYNVDDLFAVSFDRAIQVDRHDIKASLSEKVVPTNGYAMAFFPNDEPTKIEAYDDAGRKVSYDSVQIGMFNKENRLIEVIENPADTFTHVYGTENKSFPVQQTNEVTIHKGGTEMIMYLVRV